MLNSLQLLSAVTFAGAIFCFSAFCFKSMYPFLALFAIGELFVFATQVLDFAVSICYTFSIYIARVFNTVPNICVHFQAPVNFICLHCVKPSLRPMSMAISTVAIHLFGDVPSSPLVGVLQVCLHRFNFCLNDVPLLN